MPGKWECRREVAGEQLKSLDPLSWSFFRSGSKGGKSVSFLSTVLRDCVDVDVIHQRRKQRKCRETDFSLNSDLFQHDCSVSYPREQLPNNPFPKSDGEKVVLQIDQSCFDLKKETSVFLIILS